MFGLITSLFLSGSADAAKIPGAEYKLQLEDYNIELQDFRFPFPPVPRTPISFAGL